MVKSTSGLEEDFEPFEKKVKLETFDEGDAEFENTDDKYHFQNKSASKIRGITKKIGANHYYFASHKMMLEYQKKFRDVFQIQIPPPDFTEEDYAKFVFPKPIEEMLVVPEILGKTSPRAGTTTCEICQHKASSTTALKEHHVKFHTIHYLCPYDKCGHAVQKLENEVAMFKFARHIYYHNHDHPQVMCPHKCLGCGYTTPYIAKVREHLKIKGPYHDNKCPRCPERFYSRTDLLNHKKISDHEGFVCGLCPEVFETSLLRNQHRGVNHGKRKPKLPKAKIVCEDCGKMFSSQGALNTHRERVHGPNQDWPCDQCGKAFKTQYNLKAHIKTMHNKKPCPICGKMFFTERMKIHMIATHTEEHLKPFICQVCHKGFATQTKLNTHMNIHTGSKPFVCKYCGRGFADKGNARMHERTTHEGYKRPEKAKRKMNPEIEAFGQIHTPT